MALVVCKECKKQMSSTAGACPSCGYIPKKGVSFWKVIKVLIGIFCLFVLAIFLLPEDSNKWPGYFLGLSVFAGAIMLVGKLRHWLTKK